MPLSPDEIRQVVDKVRFGNWTFRAVPAGQGVYLQVEFMAENGPQRGRKWYISPWSTESEIVQTCLKAVLTALEHEAREVFAYDGVHVFHPHIPVADLMEVAKNKELRS